MNKIFNNKYFKKIAKYEIVWLFLYLAFSLAILIVLVASVLSNKTAITINVGFLIFSIFSIISLIMYLISIVYLDGNELFKDWKFYSTIFLILINLIVLPILAHYIKIDYPIYQASNNMNFSPSLSAILWLTFIFSGACFIYSIAITAIVYKQTYPFNPPVKSVESEK